MIFLKRIANIGPFRSSANIRPGSRSDNKISRSSGEKNRKSFERVMHLGFVKISISSDPNK